MRIVSGRYCKINTIAPPKIRRYAATIRGLVNCRQHARSLLYEQMVDVPHQRLISRKPVWSLDPYPSTTLYSIADAWRTKWFENTSVNGYLVLDPNTQPPRFELRRHEWVLLNRSEPTMDVVRF
jgi:hypothetical protein